MTTAPINFCTDEDLANVATSDFAALSPYDQAVVRGQDGSVLQSAPWTLNSPTADFTAAGIAPGHVLQIVGPRPPFRPPAECFGVVSAVGNSVVLRRRGQAPGAGCPVTLATDLSGVVFQVITFGPQIQRASVDLERRFGVSDFIYGRRTSDLFDPTELRDACVYSVLSAVYLDASRGTGDRMTGQPDVWAMKSGRYAELLADLLDRVEVHWGRGDDAFSPPSRVAVRLSR